MSLGDNMKLFLKKFLPKPILKFLIQVKNTLISNPSKRRLFKKMQKKHKMLLEQIKGKEKIKVVFLAIHKSVWKVDTIFQRMLKDPYFEPLILVCPYTIYGEERMWEDMNECYSYFEEKGYPLLSAFDKKEKRWLSLEEIEADIVFFTNPHSLTRKEYYEDAYLNYLTCYAGYGIDPNKYNNNEEQYNQLFHNAMWLIFVQHNEMFDCYVKKNKEHKDNVYLVIDNIIEELQKKENSEIVWKNYATHKKIIFAPHHTIEKNTSFQLGNFLDYAEYIKDLVKQTQETITWSFKPHPMLKSKLYLEPNWGKAKTDDYFHFWETQSNTQFNDGEYIELFKQSDAMIHDSGAFLAEYIFTDKPSLYFTNKNTRNYLNGFGNACLDTVVESKNTEELAKFINGILQNLDEKKETRQYFINNYFNTINKNTKKDVLNIIQQNLM
jgi:hypothetical protein